MQQALLAHRLAGRCLERRCVIPVAECLFCQIVQGTLPAQRVYEDAQALAFSDIRPQAPTHLVIIPKTHVASLNEVIEPQEKLIGHLMRLATDLARRQGLQQDGYRVVVNCGPDAGQTVAHLHLHLLGGRAMRWPPG